MSTNGYDGITILVAALIIFVCALPFGLLVALVEYPWLWLFVVAAVVIFFMARSAERRERGGR
jgi:hypothetical protein